MMMAHAFINIIIIVIVMIIKRQLTLQGEVGHVYYLTTDYIAEVGQFQAILTWLYHTEVK